MVDFTKPISNAHMAEGLKHLIAMNRDIIDECMTIKNREIPAEDRGKVETVEDIHRRHVKILSDSVLFLGDYPDSLSRANRFIRFPRIRGIRGVFMRSSLRKLEKQEKVLSNEYALKLARLKASDEVVNAINAVSYEQRILPRYLFL